MNYRKIAISAMLGCALASPSAFANLITNGGFESDAVSGGSGFDYLNDPALTGWHVSSPGHNGAVLFNATYAPGNVQGVGAGTNSLQIEYPGDFIEQAISTSIGTKYRISFLLDDYQQPPGPGGGMVTVTANLVATTPSLFDGTAAWLTYVAEFTATSASTTIRFTSSEFYPQLDNISVEAIPEPATLALLGLGLAGLGFSRRKLQA